MNHRNSTPSTESPKEDRRNFFARAAAATVGSLCGLVPFLAGITFLSDPILRKAASTSGDGFVPLGVGADALPKDGSPVAVKVLMDRTDAWNVYPNEPIGSVWLRRNSNGKVVVFNTTCPHLGCYIDYRPGNQDFFCPCHTSTFDLDGQRLNQIPPRDMDDLEVEERGGQIWVRFQNFRGATTEKTPV